MTVEARRFFAERGLDAICDCVGLNPQYVRELLRDHVGEWAADIARARCVPKAIGDCQNKTLRKYAERGPHGRPPCGETVRQR
jgi:hypothetical protein